MTQKSQMTRQEYAHTRKGLGTQAHVARELGIYWLTVSKRERGDNPITREAELALRYLVVRKDG